MNQHYYHWTPWCRKRKNMLRKHCVQCERLFYAGDMIFYTDNGYGMFICQQCSERKPMPNIKITAEVDGKQVPLETISTETFEAIKALEKPKEIPVPVARVGEFYESPRLIFKPSINIQLIPGEVYALDISLGDLGAHWKLEDESQWITQYDNVRSL